MDRQENLALATVRLGTAAGALLRRYWHPVCAEADISAAVPHTSVRLLDEEIVLYRSADDGAIQAISERCPHRGVSLRYGFAERGGLRCAYHGWKFDGNGRCVDRPFEAGPGQVCARAYPVRVAAGLVFVYIGPTEDTPGFPLWDMMAQSSGSFTIHLQDDIECNWLQVQENSADVTHTFFLHSRVLSDRKIEDRSGFQLVLRNYGFQPFKWGLLKSWRYETEPAGQILEGWGNPLVFPNMMHIEREIHWRVPIDDRSTRVIILAYDPGAKRTDSPAIVIHPPRVDQSGAYHQRDFFSQDAMAWETQGDMADRTAENLAAGDAGVRMFRSLLEEQIDTVARGERPMGVLLREQDGEVVTTRKWIGGYVPMSAPADPTLANRLQRDEVFDERHVTYETTLTAHHLRAP